MPEITLRARIGAIGADPGFGDVEIDFQDPALAPDRFDQQREPRLERLARIAPALDQEGVFGGLLADRRSAADAFASGITVIGVLDRLEVEDEVRTEFGILARARRARHNRVQKGRAWCG